MPIREQDVLVLSRAQMVSLGEAARDDYARSLMRRALDFAPRHAAALGDAQLRLVIRRCMDDASSSGFGFRGPTRFWIESAFMFGSGFCDDPMLAVVMEPLSGPPPEDGDEQVERACEAQRRAQAFADAIAGEGAELERFALELWRSATLERIAETFDEGPDVAFARLHQQKVRVMAPGSAALVSDIAQKHAARLQLDKRIGAASIATLLFVFGWNCLEDPLFPWIAKSLAPDGRDSKVRLERTRRMAIRFMASAWEN